MVDLITTLTPNRCKAGAVVTDKAHALKIISELMATDLPVSAEQILIHLKRRESLATTALGAGVAIPHARVVGCIEPISALLQLQTAQDFAAYDEQKVDLIFALIVPEQATSDHLNLLQQIAKILDVKDIYTNLRNAKTSQELWQVVFDASG